PRRPTSTPASPTWSSSAATRRTPNPPPPSSPACEPSDGPRAGLAPNGPARAPWTGWEVRRRMGSMGRMSVYALLVIRSLLVFNGLLLTLVGFVLAVFMERPAGVVFGTACW